MRRLWILALALAAVACGGHRMPEGVLGHGQMVDFLTEAYLLEGCYAVSTRYAFDTVPPEFDGAYAALLERLGVSRGQVDSSLTYYAAHPDLYAAIHEEVSARLDSIPPAR